MLQNLFEWFYLFYIPKINILDIFEILFIVLAIYQLQKNLRNTRAWVIIKGIAILVGIYVVSLLLNWVVIQTIFGEILNLSLIAMILLFEPEIKKFLELLGHSGNPIRKLSFKSKQVKCRYTNKTINDLLDACNIMAKTKTGALIVIERDSLLNEYISTGININSDISSQLLIQIFEKDTPLHDGALIIKDNKIVSATCYLPLSSNNGINKGLGTRHRAGIGLSEVTDALVIIVSEETGNISVVIDGKLKHNISLDKLSTILKENQTIKDTVVEKSSLNINGNKLLKMISSVCIGVAFWLCLINIQDPSTTREFTVPVSITNEDDLAKVGKTYEIVGNNYVSVDITAARSLVDSLEVDDIIAVADLQKLSYTNSVPVDIYFEGNLNDDLFQVNTNNAIILLELDEITDLNLNVVIEPQGSCASGYYLNSITTNTPSVTLTGAQSIIKTIDKVVLSPVIFGLQEDLVVTCKPVIYDKNGNIVSEDDVDISLSEFIVNADVLKTKEVPIRLQVVNGETEDYKLISTKLDLNRVTVAGNSDEISEINGVDISIDLLNENISENYIKAIDLVDYLPENIVPVSSNMQVNATMKFEIYEVRTFDISTEDIIVDNLASKRSCTFKEDFISLKLKGTKSALDSISIDSIICTLNTKDCNRGTFNKAISIDGLPENVILNSEAVVEFIIK